jgi:HlyD family secretion protein
MTWLKRKWLVLILLLAAVGIVSGFAFSRSPKPQYFTGTVQRGDIRTAVQATGTIDAVTTVQVGSQVSGTISKLNADFNSRVKKGDVIAEIDPSLFTGALLQTKADLQTGRAALAAANAELAKAQATATQASSDYQRNAALAKEGVISQQQLDAAKATADTALAGVNSAKAQVGSAAAQVQQKAAAVNVAQTNVDHTIIRAPIDGIVTARSVDVGQTVAASLQAPTLFSIAQDLTKMHVLAKTDESDVGNIKVGQTATFTVDAFPQQVFRGTVQQVRMNPTTVQNVVTYDTVIEFSNPEMKLFPGMTAYVTIPVAQAQNVLEVPNAALRFKPDVPADQLSALYAKSGVQPPKNQRGSQAQSNTAVVWKLAGKDMQPVQIRTGITDHSNTEVAQVMAGSLNQGDNLVLGSETAAGGNKAATAAPGMSAPGMGRGIPRR